MSIGCNTFKINRYLFFGANFENNVITFNDTQSFPVGLGRASGLGENILILTENDIELCAHFMPLWLLCFSLYRLKMYYSIYISFGSSEFFFWQFEIFPKIYLFLPLELKLPSISYQKYLIDLLRRNTLICSFGYKQKQNACFPLPAPHSILVVYLFLIFISVVRLIDIAPENKK